MKKMSKYDKKVANESKNNMANRIHDEQFEFDEIKVDFQMWKFFSSENISKVVDDIKGLKSLRDIAHKMCALNYLGWMFNRIGENTKAEQVFAAYRKLQWWAYAADSNGNCINFDNDASLHLYRVLD